MDMEEASKTVGQMLDEHVFEARAIESYLRSRGIVRSKSAMVKIMLAMAERRAPFVHFVSRNLLACASRTDEFLKLVAGLSEWRGSELGPLRRLYGRDPQTALWLIRKLEAANQDQPIPLSWLYTGVGEKEPDRLLGMMGKRLSPAQKTAWMTAVDIMYEKQTLPSEAADFVVHLSRSRTTKVQKCAIYVMLARAQESERIRDRLCCIARNGSDEARASLANVDRLGRPGDRFLFKILRLCSKTQNADVRESISMALASYAHEHPLECIKIVRRWSGDLEFCYRLDFLLAAIGKGGPDKLRRFMESWIRDARGSKADALPRILSCVYRENEMRLVELLEAVGHKTAHTLLLAILETFFSDGYAKDHRSDDFCKRTETVVLEIAKQRGTNARPNLELNPFMRVLDLIKQTKHPINASVADAQNNLKRFKNLSRIIEPNRLEEMIRDGHTLAVWLSHAAPDPQMEGSAVDPGKPGTATRRQDVSRAWVSEIDAALRAFGDGQGTSRIRRGLVSKAEFFDTLAELVVAAKLEKKFPVALQPRVGNNTLDVESTVGGSRVLFEVFRPKEDIRLSYVRTTHELSNAIRAKMVKKIDGQIKSALGAGVPVVLVIDCTDAREIDDRDIADSLFGTECFTVPFGKDGAAGRPRPGRKKDSVHDQTSNAGAISAVLRVEMDCDETEIRISGSMFRAPRPAVPLDDGTADAIGGALFETA